MHRTLAILVLVAACHGAEGKQQPAPAPTKVTEPAPGPAPGSGSAELAGSADGSDDYVPAEFKSGMARWKDTVVYLDGRPIGFLQFGELPITLKPTWVKSKVSQNKPPGCPSCPAWKWGEERFYRFTDYLKAVGVNVARIKELHVQGPKIGDTIIATGKDLMSPAAKDFMFRFGGYVAGKAIPHVPDNFGNGAGPDKITSVMIYIDRTPPKIVDGSYVLDGHPIEGVPYYGEPVRGGIRVYFDDRLAAIIKRQDLDPKTARTNPDGSLSWNLYGFLQKNGVDTKKIVEGWVVRDERRQEEIPAAQLQTMWFQAAAKSGKGSQGAILLGDQKIVANVLALHSRVIKKDELPVIRPEEE